MTCYALDGRPGSSSGFPGGERVDRGASVHPPVTRTMLRDVGNQTLSGWSALQRRFTTLSWTVGAGSPRSPGSPRIVPGRGVHARGFLGLPCVAGRRGQPNLRLGTGRVAPAVDVGGDGADLGMGVSEEFSGHTTTSRQSGSNLRSQSRVPHK